MKSTIFHPKAEVTIEGFPTDAQRKIHKLLSNLQMGDRLSMPSSRAMPSVAPGVAELRIRGREGAYRVFYKILEDGNVLVFHAFVKKSTKTKPLEIALARKRLWKSLNEE